ncbi:FAD-dependent oxidoreductase [Streptomyces sp. NPDC059740]|uniref:FAD-dependent oxidoreductase n=1 Tax=Streptomyces sp. NPDC059740 TaxID=3346926 RepID=UPI00365ACEAC
MAEHEVLITGAGVVGARAAYHLTAPGHEQVTVRDSRPRAALPGSTGPAPGFVGRQAAHLLTGSGALLVAPRRPAPDRFAMWSAARIRDTAPGRYQGIHDAH